MYIKMTGRISEGHKNIKRPGRISEDPGQYQPTGRQGAQQYIRWPRRMPKARDDINKFWRIQEVQEDTRRPRRIPGGPGEYQETQEDTRRPRRIPGDPGGYQETQEDTRRFWGQQSDAVDSGA